MIIKILGSGQDAGIPHTGCYCEECNRARKYAQYRRLGPSMAILDKKERFCYLVDASLDFKCQLDMIREEIRETQRNGKTPVSGILLTHAHIGHCAGLWHFGRESVEERNLPVFCTSKMKQFLCSNYPFSLLIQRENIRIQEVQPNKEFTLNDLKFMPIQVPHRNEIADTVGYIIRSNKKVIYLPDVDKWSISVIKEIRSSDIAFLDGTFYSKNEIPRFEKVPHPTIPETINLLENANTEIYFTHINHTNPVNKKSKERKYVESKGFKIAYDGMKLEF